MTTRLDARRALQACAVAGILLLATTARAAESPPTARTKPDSTETTIVTRHRITVAGKALAHTSDLPRSRPPPAA